MVTRVADVRTAQPPSTTGPEPDDDKALVLAFQSGEVEAYSDIYVKYRALVAQICYRILQNREEADEAVQETMLRVFRGLPRFNGRYQLQAWMARIATNVSLDMVRARARRPQMGPPLHDISEGHAAFAAFADEDVSEGLERVLDQEQVRSILSAIPEHHREALVLREFEGRSHEEIGDALGVSPQQAKALIHRAKRSFRRAWGEGEERRGITGLAPILLAPFRLPGLLRKLIQPAHDAVTSATATAQQAAVQVTAAPAAVQTAMSGADKVTAAALTVIVAGTLSVGAVAIRRHASPAAKSSPSASAAPAPSIAPPVIAPPVKSKPTHRARHPKHHAVPAPGGGTSPSSTTEPSPTPSPSPSGGPSPGPSESPPPPPPAPGWSTSFHSSVGIGSPQLSLIDSQVVGGPGGDLTFGQTIQGDTLDQAGKPFGFLNIEYNGEVLQGGDSLLSLWIWVDTPDGRYTYQATGSLTAVVQASDGTTTYYFSAPYVLTDVPQALDGSSPHPVPHAGMATLTLKFWVDGSLYASGLSLMETAST